MTQEELFKILVAHCKEYGFIFPSSEIYDGLGAVYDYGQLGSELKSNIKRYWWEAMTRLNEKKLAILLGTEGFGLSQKSIDLADDRIIIPMQNGVDSLNVAAASAVAFFQLGHSSGSDSCRGVENP